MQVVRLLLKAQADVELANTYGDTPVMLAAEEGRAQILRMLLDARADKEKADNEGDTALLRASRKGSARGVHMLLTAGADKDSVNKSGDTALIRACRTSSAATVSLLLQARADTEVSNEFDETAFTCARERGDEPLARLLSGDTEPATVWGSQHATQWPRMRWLLEAVKGAAGKLLFCCAIRSPENRWCCVGLAVHIVSIRLFEWWPTRRY